MYREMRIFEGRGGRKHNKFRNHTCYASRVSVFGVNNKLSHWINVRTCIKLEIHVGMYTFCLELMYFIVKDTVVQV